MICDACPDIRKGDVKVDHKKYPDGKSGKSAIFMHALYWLRRPWKTILMLIVKCTR